MLLAANALLATGAALVAHAEGLASGAFALLLCGAGYAFINPATARAVLMWFPRTSRATVMSLKQTGVPAGGVIGATIAAAGHADWRALMLGVAVASVVAAAAYVPLRPAREAESHAVRFADILALVKVPQLTWFNLASCLYAIGQAAFFAYLVLYALDAVGASLAIASLCLAIAHVASATGRIVWGIASDRTLQRGRVWCIIAIGILAAIGVLLFVVVPALGTWALLVTSALVGITLGSYAGLTQAATVELVDSRHTGAAIGYNMVLLSLGTMLGPALFGYGVETWGYAESWSALAVLLLGGAALYRVSAR
jgi:predicted MFS family arabinose efflux permease